MQTKGLMELRIFAVGSDGFPYLHRMEKRGPGVATERFSALAGNSGCLR